MIRIDFKDNKFLLDFTTGFIDRDEFMSEVDYLKSFFIFFNKEYKKWVISFKDIEEKLAWFDKTSKEYILTDLAKETLDTYKQSIYKRELKVYRGITFDNTILNEGVQLKNFQKRDVHWRLSRNVYLDASDTGTGKTVQNICIFSQLYKNNKVDGIIILVPLGLAYNWQEEILSKVNVFKKEDIQIIDNLLKVKCFEKFTDKKILIIRHDLYADVIASYRKDYLPRKSLASLHWSTADYVDIKKAWNKNNIFLCIDECDAFKNTDAVKVKAIYSTKRYFDYRALLSATPWINGIEDSYSLLSFIDSSVISMSENAFKLWISQSIGNRHDRYAITEYNTLNVQKLMLDYKNVFLQVLKEDEEEIKTIKYYKDIKFDILSEQQLLYQEVTQKTLEVLYKEYDKITWKLLESKLHLILEIFDNPLLLLKREYSNDINTILSKWKIENDPKFIYLKERLEHLIDYKNKKVIIYDIHPATIDLLAEKFKKYNPLTIHGELKVKDKELDRQEKQKLFNFNNDYKLMILSAFTSSRGLNLQYGSSNIIWYSLPFDATLTKQGSERTDRVTSTQNSTIEYLYYPHSIDGYRYRKVINREKFNKLLDKEVSQEDLEKLLNGQFRNVTNIL